MTRPLDSYPPPPEWNPERNWHKEPIPVWVFACAGMYAVLTAIFIVSVAIGK
jgi:hypothetical protein